MIVGEECVRRRRCGIGASPGLTSWTILATGKERVNVEVCERLSGKFRARKSLRKMRKTLLPRQNQVQSDEETRSLSRANLFIICVYDLQRKKLWMGSDAGRYLIR